MCDAGIIEGAAVAVQIGGAIVGAAGQNKASKENKKAVLADLSQQRNDLSVRAIQEKQAAGADIHQADVATLGAEATTRAGASAAGVAGMSIDQLLGTMEGENAQYRQSVNDNLVVSLDQIERAKKGAEAQARNRIMGVPGANPFVTGLQIAGAGLDYAKWKIDPKRNP